MESTARILQKPVLYRIIIKGNLLSHMKSPILLSLGLLPYFTHESIKQILGRLSVSEGTISALIYCWIRDVQIVPLTSVVDMTQRIYK